MMLKRELNKQYREWRHRMNNRRMMGTTENHRESREFENSFQERIENHKKCLENSLLAVGNFESKRLVLKLLIKEIDHFKVELIDKFRTFYLLNDRLMISGLDDTDSDTDDDTDDETDDEIQEGLTIQRIQQFEQFTADESFVDDQCVICMGEIEIGRNMMRLDCDGQHTFCQVCVEGWFADHNTCPICRHKF